jgi:hypothetical protein
MEQWMIPMKKTGIVCEEWLSDSKSSEFELEDEYRRKWYARKRGSLLRKKHKANSSDNGEKERKDMDSPK